MVNLRTTSKTISNKLNKLERRVTSKLNAFYKSKIRPNATLFPIETLRQKYDAEVRVIIRKAVQDSYLEGTDLVGQQIAEKAPDFQLFTSVTDINNIQAITNDMANQFWTTTGKLVQRENESILKEGELVPKPSFDAKAAMIGLAALFTFGAFNKAVKSKLFPAVTAIQNPPSEPSNVLDLTIGFEIKEIKGKVMFMTQEDAKVDPEICQPLNRTVYEAGDPETPDPPLHRFCRCHLVPFIE
jgi:hypothetical protein